MLAQYEAYTRNALLQLRRMREGNQIEQDHMRNRPDDRPLADGQHRGDRAPGARRQDLLRDGRRRRVPGGGGDAARRGAARIKSEGDYDAARTLFETHGIYFDPALRDEVVARVDAVGLPSYSGFVQPRLEPVLDDAGEIVDVAISYPLDLTVQMLEYSGKRVP